MIHANRTARSAAFCALAVAPYLLTGCSLFVMAGKMLLGDPVEPCAFKAATHVDLTRDAVKVLVVCTARESLKSDHSALDVELIDGVTRRLKVQNISVINPDKVARWLDDNGGTFEHPADLVQHFNTDFILHIDLERCTFTEDNTPNLYHGQAAGNVMAYDVQKINGIRTARHIFERGFNFEHPTYPVAADSMSPKTFEKQFLDRVCDRVSYMFYDHRMSAEIQ